MKNSIRLLLLAVIAQLGLTAAHAQVLVIANNNVSASSISKAEVKDIFTGNASTVSGSHVTPVLLKQGGAHESFLTTFIGKNDAAFKATWRNLVFSGQASMPKTLDSEAALVEYVAHNPGAIGYISSATPHEGVKVLSTR